jgi:hypothetical protein
MVREPFLGLVQLRERLQAAAGADCGKTHATCLIVTHAPAEAIRLGVAAI